MKNLSMAVLAATVLAMASGAQAEPKYDPGASDTEIRIGQTIAYSGPASVISALGRTQVGYFKALNAKGGINGRRVTLLSEDDGYNPPKTVEMVRKLVERDEVLAIMGSNGTATNLAVRDYLKAQDIPQLWLICGCPIDAKDYPGVTVSTQDYVTEGELFAKYILETNPSGTIAILEQNDDYGQELVRGLRNGLGDKADEMIVGKQTYDRADPTVDSQMSQLAATDADFFFSASYGKFAAQAIRFVGSKSNWNPVQLLVYGASGVPLQMEGETDLAKGIVGVTFFKNPADPSYDDDEDMKTYKAFLKEWVPEVSESDPLGVNGYISASLTHYTLEKAGDNLTRENLIKVASNFDDLTMPMLLPGVTLSMSPDDYQTYKAGRIQVFNGTNWVVQDGALSVN